MQNNQKLRVWIEVAVVIVVGLGAFLLGRVFWPVSGPSSQNVSPAAPLSATQAPVPAGTAIPDANSTNLSAGVAKPEVVKPASATSPLSVRDFNITVQNNALAPDTVITRIGDILNINFQSKDNAYEFVQPDYALGWQVSPTSPKSLQFQADRTGKFTFYCPACGGPAKGPVGYIIVVSK